MERYAAKLKTKESQDHEITRRTKLIRTERNQLESDYWNRFYNNHTSNFNRAPNGFLVRMVEGRSSGVALDYGMGKGGMPSIWRNSAGKYGDSTLPMPQLRLLKSDRKSWG